MKRNSWIGLGVLGASLLAAGAGVTAASCRRRLKAELDEIRSKGEPLTFAEAMGADVSEAENAASVYDRVFAELKARELDSDMNAIALFPLRRAYEQDWEETREALKGIEGLASMVGEALDRPYCVFSGDPDTIAERFHAMRALLRALRVRAVLRAHDGDFDAAARTVETMVRLCVQLGESVSHSYMGTLLYVYLCNVTSSTVAAVARRSGLTEAQGEAIFSLLTKVDLRRALTQGLIGERAQSLERVYGVDPETGVCPALKCPDALAYLGAMDRSIRRASLPYRQARHVGLYDLAPLPIYAHIAKINVVECEEGCRQVDIAIARMAGSMTSLALNVYERRYGSYPDSLDGLRAKLGWRIPEDPFSGGDLVYRPEPGGFVLYSIGPDMVDDGGQELSYLSDHDLPFGDGDIVWQVRD